MSRPRGNWNKAQIMTLRKMWNDDCYPDEIGRVISKSSGAVAMKAKALGLRRPKLKPRDRDQKVIAAEAATRKVDKPHSKCLLCDKPRCEVGFGVYCEDHAGNAFKTNGGLPSGFQQAQGV